MVIGGEFSQSILIGLTSLVPADVKILWVDKHHLVCAGIIVIQELLKIEKGSYTI